MPAFLAWPVIKAFLGGVLGSVWKAIKAFFGSLNSQGWIGFIGCAALGLLWLHTAGEARHWHKQSDQYQKLYNRELDHEAKIAKQAVDLKAKVDALTSNISSTLKERNDEENRRIAADADALRLRGPGKAVCPGSSGAASAPVRRDQGVAPSSVAGPEVPSDDRAAVSWEWLVKVVQEHDELLSKVQSVEAQHEQLQRVWPQDAKK